MNTLESNLSSKCSYFNKICQSIINNNNNRNNNTLFIEGKIHTYINIKIHKYETLQGATPLSYPGPSCLVVGVKIYIVLYTMCIYMYLHMYKIMYKGAVLKPGCAQCLHKMFKSFVFE